jgi:hypothetical protein
MIADILLSDIDHYYTMAFLLFFIVFLFIYSSNTLSGTIDKLAPNAEIEDFMFLEDKMFYLSKKDKMFGFLSL